MTSIEQKILICSTQMHSDPDHNQRLRQLMSLPKDQDFLINMSIKEGTASLLYKNLFKAGLLDTLHPEQRKILQSFYHQTVLLNLKLIHSLKEVLHELNKKKIQVVLLQGIILLGQVYEDVGLRPLSDIDLWVLRKDYPDVTGILSSLGYQRNRVYPNTFRRGPTTFDLHTHILWADRIKARTFLLTKSQDSIYEDTRIIQFEGKEARCLSRYDQVLYLSIHALKHNVNRLIWLVDIQNLLADWKNSDWEALIKRARNLGQEKSIFYIFTLLHQLLDFHLPREAWKLLESKKLHYLEKRALTQRTKKGSLPFWTPLVLFSPRKGLRKRFSFVFETLFPRPEILRQIFPDRPDLKVWKLYRMRALQLLRRIKMS